MDIETARKNIGKQYRWMLGDKWDTIKSVDQDGYIHGEFMIVHANDCKLKLPEPQQLLQSRNKLKTTVAMIAVVILLASCCSQRGACGQCIKPNGKYQIEGRN